MQRRLLFVAVVFSSCGVATTAAAQPTREEMARADALFREGRAMMAAGKLPAACEKLDASYRLAPGLGTLINLGACHEASGKMARAYGVYRRAGRIAREAGRFDREKEAGARSTVLETKVGRVRHPARLDDHDAQLACDGEVAETVEPGLAVLDPGEHTCTIEAGRKTKWHGVLTVAAGQSQTVDTSAPPAPAAAPVASPVASPVVSSQRASEPAAAEPSPPPSSSSPAAEPKSGTALVGWAALAAGVAALGTGAFFAVRAKSKDDDAGSRCDARGCTQEGVALGEEAKDAGNVATVFAAAGLAVLAGGIVMLVVSRPSGTQSASWSVGPLSAARAGLSVRF